MEMNEVVKDVLENAIAWVEENYLRNDFTPTEMALINSVNSYLEKEGSVTK